MMQLNDSFRELSKNAEDFIKGVGEIIIGLFSFGLVFVLPVYVLVHFIIKYW